MRLSMPLLSHFSLYLNGLLLLALGAGAQAHDFWIEPSTYRPAPGTILEVGLRHGTSFQGLPFGRDPTHFKRFSVSGPSGEKPVFGRPGRDPAGWIQIDQTGPLILAYVSTAQTVELEPEAFEAYLLKEGLERIVQVRAQQGHSQTPGRELYSRCAKALVQAGGISGPDRRLGMELELVLQARPDSLRPGMPLQLLFRDQPLAGALVTCTSIDPDWTHHSARTDSQGQVQIPLRHLGPQLCKSVHMTPADNDLEADWQSFWASLTLEIAP